MKMLREGHVRHFVGHDASELGLVGGGSDGSDVDEHRSVRQCESIDLFLGDDVEVKGPGVFRWDGSHEFLAKLPNVSDLGAVVRQDRQLLVDLCSSLQTQLALLVAGHLRIAGSGELGTGGLGVRLSSQQ